MFYGKDFFCAEKTQHLLMCGTEIEYCNNYIKMQDGKGISILHANVAYHEVDLQF